MAKSDQASGEKKGTDSGDLSLNRALESPEEFMEVAQDFLNRATRTLEREVKRRPYQVLGGALSLGYFLGQGWVRAISKMGLAYLAQQATKGVLPSFGTAKNQTKTIH